MLSSRNCIKYKLGQTYTNLFLTEHLLKTVLVRAKFQQRCTLLNLRLYEKSFLLCSHVPSSKLMALRGLIILCAMKRKHSPLSHPCDSQIVYIAVGDKPSTNVDAKPGLSWVM